MCPLAERVEILGFIRPPMTTLISTNDGIKLESCCQDLSSLFSLSRYNIQISESIQYMKMMFFLAIIAGLSITLKNVFENNEKMALK